MPEAVEQSVQKGGPVGWGDESRFVGVETAWVRSRT